MTLPLIAFTIWIVLLTGLTFLFWLRPQSFFPNYQAQTVGGTRDVVSIVSTLLGILLFISCFLIGVWLAVAELRGHI